MTSPELQPYEARAQKAEDRLTALELRLKELVEQQSKTGVRSNSLDDVKLLEQLKQMKKTLEGALIEQKVLLEEKAKIQQEKETLAAKLNKLEYRVKHLVKAVREGEARNI